MVTTPHETKHMPGGASKCMAPSDGMAWDVYVLRIKEN